MAACPFPGMIPVSQDIDLLKSYGVKIIGDPKIVSGKKFVKYELPEGWSYVDDSGRSDLPTFYILDEEGCKRASISGRWKIWYDNDLNLYVYKEPFSKFEKENMVVKDGGELPLDYMSTLAVVLSRQS